MHSDWLMFSWVRYNANYITIVGIVIMSIIITNTTITLS